MYAIKVTCKEAVAENGTVHVEEGEVAWVVRDEWGWSSSTFPLHSLGSRLVTFKRKDEAEKEAREWRGHPWYYTPLKVEAVQVRPKYKKVLNHWVEGRHSFERREGLVKELC
jgi:hypothetical protein